MQQNKLPYSLILLSLILSSLLLLSFLPEIKLGGLTLKRINLLSDIKPDPPPKKIKKDTLRKTVVKNKVPPSKVFKNGLTSFEDYSENKKAFSHFFNALNAVKNRPVRIAFFGDSFIEGDILAASLRDTLQTLFGGQGVGYVSLASEVAHYRTSIQHTYSNWTTYSIVGKRSEQVTLGLPGYCFVPQENNMVEFKPAKRRNPIPFKSVRLLYSNPTHAAVDYVINDTTTRSLNLKTSAHLEEAQLGEGDIQSIKLHFNNYDSLRLYGISFEEGNGIYVDNLAMRGNSGVGLYNISSYMNNQFNSYQNYKLIILQYGLNVVTENDSLGYAWYIDKMVRTVNKVKSDFPESSILLLSVSDRSSNQNGEFKTIPYITAMRDAQRTIAKKTGIAFWDMHTAMGGEGSMTKFVNAAPPLAAKDYTHLTFRGGRKIAKKLADAILFERRKYATKK
jgi:lysophospholipase L1-like esterase